MGNFFQQSDGLTTVAARRARSLIPSHLAGQAGISLVEILVAGLVVGIALIGVTLMYGTGSTWVAAMGDDRVGAGLAQQRIEQIRADATSQGWDSAAVSPGISSERVDPVGCDDLTPQCQQTPKYRRLTCIQYVDPSTANGINPAYTPDCPAAAGGSPNPSSMRRITVTVTPVFVDNARVERPVVRAYTVMLQGWITQSGQ
jgi:Tfp pilus assembly protein PilV